ncbi:cytolethal distending toxin subunit B family protein [Aeromonas veronii]|uniref:cytolethal distending toxin subunit B family protein n=1 Tax=Aeromonas veronii TaxID=654 RepID=UPI003D22A14F
MGKQISIILVFFFWVIPSVSYANLDDKRVVSWNLQGASHATESKWNVNVAVLLRGGVNSQQNVDIINIQEAGTPPPTATLLPQLGARLVNPDNLAVPVEEYEWDLGTRYRRNIFYIYFSRVDTGANRVNLAIVSRQRASRVIILGTSVFPGHGRPVLGIEVDNSYYFNIHAIANGGSDSGVVTERVWNYFNQNNDQSSWMITGDFNRNPFGMTNSLQRLLDTNYPHVSQNVTIISQNSPTQNSGGILDYAVVGQINSINAPLSNPRASLFTAGLLGQMASDHTPVIFYKR